MSKKEIIGVTSQGVMVGKGGTVLGQAAICETGTKPTNVKRFTLTDEDFATLVKGDVVGKDLDGFEVQFILEDIGFDRMLAHVFDAAQRSGS